MPLQGVMDPLHALPEVREGDDLGPGGPGFSFPAFLHHVFIPFLSYDSSVALRSTVSTVAKRSSERDEAHPDLIQAAWVV